MAAGSGAVEVTLAIPMRARRTHWQGLAGFARRKPVGLGSALFIMAIVLIALAAPLIAPYDPTQQTEAGLRPPSSTHPFGTDNFGRDILSQVIFGARVSLAVGLAAVCGGTMIGTLIGLTSGYLEGKTDLLFQRLMDAWMAFPGILLALAIMSGLGPGLTQTIIAVGITGVPTTNRIVRSTVLSTKRFDYVAAARALGAKDFRIALVHVVPNVLAPLIVIGSLALGRAILVEASLSFLGLGIPPPNPAWGRMLSGEARSYMIVAPWMMIWPGIAISLTVLAWNLLGDTLRDTLDPRLRGV